MNDRPIPMPDPTPWLAAARKYVAGSLTAAECHDFEDALASEQSAREALVMAMRESGPVLPAGTLGPQSRLRQRVRSRLRQSWRRLSWKVKWAAAAALLIGMSCFAALQLPRTADTAPAGLALRDEAQAEPETYSPDEKDSLEATVFAELSSIDRMEQMHRARRERRERELDWSEQRSTLSPLRAGRILPIATDE